MFLQEEEAYEAKKTKTRSGRTAAPPRSLHRATFFPTKGGQKEEKKEEQKKEEKKEEQKKDKGKAKQEEESGASSTDEEEEESGASSDFHSIPPIRKVTSKGLQVFRELKEKNRNAAGHRHSP